MAGDNNQQNTTPLTPCEEPGNAQCAVTFGDIKQTSFTPPQTWGEYFASFLTPFKDERTAVSFSVPEFKRTECYDVATGMPLPIRGNPPPEDCMSEAAVLRGSGPGGGEASITVCDPKIREEGDALKLVIKNYMGRTPEEDQGRITTARIATGNTVTSVNTPEGMETTVACYARGQKTSETVFRGEDAFHTALLGLLEAQESAQSGGISGVDVDAQIAAPDGPMADKRPSNICKNKNPGTRPAK